MKTFQDFLFENDQEYTYIIKAVRDLHDDWTMDQIRLAFTPHDLRDLDRGSYTPPGSSNKYFPEKPNHPTFELKVVTGMMVDPMTMISKIAWFTKAIRDDEVLVYRQGSDPREAYKPEEVTDEYTPTASTEPEYNATVDRALQKDTQGEVGVTRISNLMKELEDERKHRDGYVREEPVYESFCTSHLAIQGTFGKSVRKGHYVVEQYKDKAGEATVTGPFLIKPDNYDYVHGFGENVSDVKLLSENKSNKLSTYVFEFMQGNDNPAAPKASKMGITVQDQDSGT